MGFAVALERTAAYAAKVEALRAALGAGAINPVLLAAAMPVVNAAKQKAPYLTGTLRRSIRAEVRDGAVGRVTIWQPRPNGRERSRTSSSLTVASGLTGGMQRGRARHNGGGGRECCLPGDSIATPACVPRPRRPAPCASR